MKLICPECRYENETERIYCHECGARLDRSAVTKPDPKKKVEDARRRLRYLDPQRAKIRLAFFKTSKIILGAFLTAAVLQMLLPPDVPPAIKSVSLPPQIGLDLENAAMDHRATPITYTEADVNAYLENFAKRKQSSLKEWLLDFDRVIVGFDEGRCRIIAQRSFFGYPLYATTICAVEPHDGKVLVSNYGGSIGRLPVHPQIMKFDDLLFGDLWAALSREQKTVSKMAALEFHPQSVVLTPAP
ncbi:MAG: hypothetical protein QOI04_1649 [Verrucomicrobiota bacterium]|jgi:hypothetical protein